MSDKHCRQRQQMQRFSTARKVTNVSNVGRRLDQAPSLKQRQALVPAVGRSVPRPALSSTQVVDIDFENAAGFLGRTTHSTEGQFMVYYLSNAMMFCVGVLIEAHVVLTPASCVIGEKYKFEVYGGTHRFLEYSGVPRLVQHLCIHRGYNHSTRWTHCSSDNLALLVLNKQYSFNKREPGSEFVINRVRYGSATQYTAARYSDTTCRFYGWGSRRNGYLIPLLIEIRTMDVNILPPDKCQSMWDNHDKYLCIQQPACKSEKFGALCPDDMGSVIVCSGFAQGMMTSRLVDRPCGIGFLDLTFYNKFLTCGVDDSRDVIDHEEYMSFEFTTQGPRTLALITPPHFNKTKEFEKTTPKEKQITHEDEIEPDAGKGDDGDATDRDDTEDEE